MRKNVPLLVLVLAGAFFLLILLAAKYCISQAVQDGDYCLSCHSNAAGLDKKFLHPLVSEKKCRACHISYDAALHKEAEAPVLDTCLSCHGEQKLGRSHPVGGNIIDPNTNTMMTCVSSCHLKHGSDYKYQVPFKNNMELCLSCHKEF